MAKRRKPKQTNQSNDQAEQANRQRNDEAEEADQDDPPQPPPTRKRRTRKPKQSALEGPLRRSSRVSRNKSSAFNPFSYDIERLMIGTFLSKLDMHKQIQLRSVSQLWQGEVAHNCKLVKALVLFLKDPAEGPNQRQEETLLIRTRPILFNWDKEDRGITIAPRQVTVLSIREPHWNRETIECIGQLFRHIKHLSIYDDTTGAPPNSDKYSALWSMLPSVDAFILRIKSVITRDDFLVRLFGHIEDHLAPLEALALRLETNIVFPRLPPENIARTTQYMRNFSLNCSVANLNEIFQMVGRDLHVRFPKKTPPIRELEMNATIGEEQVEPMFVHNPALGSVTWLRLTEVANLKVACALLEHCHAVESLWLNKQRRSAICFGDELFTAVSKMTNLRMLLMFRFDIFYFGTIYNARRATQVRELYVNKHGQFEYVLQEWRKRNGAVFDQDGNPRSILTLYRELGETPEAIFRPFVANVARLFPNLEVFVLTTNLVFVDRASFEQWCKEEFKCIKTAGIANVPHRIYQD